MGHIYPVRSQRPWNYCRRWDLSGHICPSYLCRWDIYVWLICNCKISRYHSYEIKPSKRLKRYNPWVVFIIFLIIFGFESFKFWWLIPYIHIYIRGIFEGGVTPQRGGVISTRSGRKNWGSSTRFRRRRRRKRVFRGAEGAAKNFWALFSKFLGNLLIKMQ